MFVNGLLLGELFVLVFVVCDCLCEIIKECLEDIGCYVVYCMECYFNMFGMIVLIGLLFGLFGIVIGLICMFLDVMKGGVGDFMKMVGGIGEVLICMVFGLVVVILVYVLYCYFCLCVIGYCVEMEKEVIVLFDDLMLGVVIVFVVLCVCCILIVG